MQPTYTQYHEEDAMKDHPQAEVQLTIRKHGIVLSVDDEHGGLSSVAVRVLRALELGGMPLVSTAVYDPHPNLLPNAVPLRAVPTPPDPAAQQDEDELVEHIAEALWVAGSPATTWRRLDSEVRDSMCSKVRLVLGILRAKGWPTQPDGGVDGPTSDAMLAALGDKDEAFLGGTIRRCLDCRKPVFGGPARCTRCAFGLTLRAKNEAVEELGHKLDVAQAQVRALTQKCEEANAALASAARWPNDGRLVTQADWDQRFKALATTEQAYRREQDARLAAEHHVLEVRDREAQANAFLAEVRRQLGEAEKALAMLREQAEADKKRIAALEVVNEEVQSNNEALRGSELQAKAAMDG